MMTVQGFELIKINDVVYQVTPNLYVVQDIAFGFWTIQCEGDDGVWHRGYVSPKFNRRWRALKWLRMMVKLVAPLEVRS